MSNLTVSYVSQTPPGTAPVGVSATAAAPAADSPLGFLAALVDQLLAGGAEAAKTEIAAKTGPSVDVPGLMNFAVEVATPVTGFTPTTTEPSGLFAALGVELDKLAAKLDTGETPLPGQLQDLRKAIAALSEALDAAAPAPAANPLATITTTAEIGRTGTPVITGGQIVELLTKLGLIEPVDADPSSRTVPTTQADAPDPVVALHDRLIALSQTLAATSPDLSQKLEALAGKIAAAPELIAQLSLAAPQPDPDVGTIAQIVRTLLGHGADTDEPASRPSEPTTANVAPKLEDDLLKILATLGIDVPAATASTATAETPVDPAAAVPAATAASTASVVPAATPTPASAAAAVPAPLLRLANQLSKISSELASAAPELAKKIETVATQLVSVAADPELISKLTSAASQPSGTALDKLVQSLIDPKSAPAVATAPAAPQISASAELAIPALLAPTKSKSAVAEVKAAPPEPAAVTADSAPKPAQNVTLTAVAQEPAGDPKPEAKAEAKATAIIVADATKSDSATQPVQPQPQAPAVAQQARPLPAAYHPVANPINMGQVAFEMVRQVHQGSSRFTIRLDPPEMGRVDVKLHVDASGAVSARLTVDRAETLDLFQRDRQQLERALSQAGLDAGKTNLEFSLRQNNHNPFAGMMGGDQQHHQPGYGAQSRFSLAENDDLALLPAVTLYRGTASAGGVNIVA